MRTTIIEFIGIMPTFAIDLANNRLETIDKMVREK